MPIINDSIEKKCELKNQCSQCFWRYKDKNSIDYKKILKNMRNVRKINMTFSINYYRNCIEYSSFLNIIYYTKICVLTCR